MSLEDNDQKDIWPVTDIGQKRKLWTIVLKIILLTTFLTDGDSGRARRLQLGNFFHFASLSFHLLWTVGTPVLEEGVM